MALAILCLFGVGSVWMDLADKISPAPRDTTTAVVERRDEVPSLNGLLDERQFVSNLTVSEQGAITMRLRHRDAFQRYAVVTLIPSFKNGVVSWRCNSDVPPSDWKFLTSACQ